LGVPLLPTGSPPGFAAESSPTDTCFYILFVVFALLIYSEPNERYIYVISWVGFSA
jgi:hypothetical protein